MPVSDGGKIEGKVTFQGAVPTKKIIPNKDKEVCGGVREDPVMLVGADNFGVESFPSKDPKNFVPGHSYLLAERGVSLLVAMWLDDLSKDQVYEFLFIASPWKVRGGTASPIRPLAIPIQRK